MELKAKTIAGQVAELVAKGWTTEQISKELHITGRRIMEIRRRFNNPGLDSRRISEIHEMVLAMWALLDELYTQQRARRKQRTKWQEENRLTKLMAKHDDRFAEIQAIESGPEDEEISLSSSSN